MSAGSVEGLERLWGAPAVEAAREALRGAQAWVVGGAVRDALRGERVVDVDLVVARDEDRAARTIARHAGGASFPLSEELGAWRVVAHDGWQVDVARLRAAELEGDLELRDFSVNAVAVPLAGGEPIDPLGGRADLDARRLRAAGPRSFEDDPLRLLRAARIGAELGLELDGATVELARASAHRAAEPAAERQFAELRAAIAGRDPLRALELMDLIGVTPVVLPELESLRGVEQNPYHHLDVHGHTLDVLAQLLELERDPERTFGPQAEAVARVLEEPLADDLTRAGALRLGALLHDVGKPQTRSVSDDGRVLFMGHDRLGERIVARTLGRFRSSAALARHVGALTLHHLRLGFLVHERPLQRRDLYSYLRQTEPVEVDVTVLSIADRLATRGERSRREAIDAHLELAVEVVAHALRWREEGGAPAPPIRGDDLARELGIEPGPVLGEVLEELRVARFAGEVRGREEAIDHARRFLAER